MVAINDNNRKIHSVTQVVDELGIAPQEMVDLAAKLKCTFLINIPDNTEVLLAWPKKKVLPADFFEPPGCTSRRADDESVIISPEIEFLCLTASDCELILQRDEFRKKEFTSVALSNKSMGITCINPIHYARRYLTDKNSTAYMCGYFLSCQPQNMTNINKQIPPALEKSISIRFDELLISNEELQKVRKELNNKKPFCGKFKKEEWASTMLAQLNEASTHFFSGESNNIDKTQLRNEITKLLSRKWVRGKDVLEQAANAILPDELYPKAPVRTLVDEALRHEYNDYASTSLIIINEVAKKYWKEMKLSKYHAFAKNETIKDDLVENQGMSTKLAGAAATIIRPDDKK